MPSAEHSKSLIDWDNDQPVSRRFGDVYFSRESGIDEARFVFLGRNGLEERWPNLPPGGRFTLGETGFGFGLNVLCAWQLWDRTAPASARLHILSFEKDVLPARELSRLYRRWPDLAPYAGELVAQWSALADGWHRFAFAGGRITLTVAVGDVRDTLPQADARVDAWFLDGFAPAKNPDMWTDAVLAGVARLSTPGATFATYSSAGAVRRGLESAGFAVERAAGFGAKREMLRGRLARPCPAARTPPWFQRPRFDSPLRTAIVIGGGLAGTASAHSLAARGYEVTLIERHPTIAAEGSGNAQGVLYARLAAHATALRELVLAGYQHTLRALPGLLARGEDWQACGVLQLGFDRDEALRQEALARAGFPAALLRPVDRHEAAALAGLDVPHGGLHFAGGGWVHPPALCRALAARPGIDVRTETEALTLAPVPGGGWDVACGHGRVARASLVIVAAAADAARFAPTSHLPLKRIRGQVSQVRTTPAASLRTVLCGDGYVAPARGGWHTFGATHRFREEAIAVTIEEHAENVAKLRTLCPALHAALDTNMPAGRSAFRCTSPDYTPIVGPVADAAAFARAYAALARDATLIPDVATPWHHGLYVNTAHGSRGLVTALVAAELLASEIDGEPLPLAARVAAAMHPNRFLVRDLIRRRHPVFM